MIRIVKNGVVVAVAVALGATATVYAPAGTTGEAQPEQAAPATPVATQATAGPQRPQVSRANLERVNRRDWNRYVNVEGVDVTEVTLVEQTGLSDTGVLVATADGTRTLLPVGGELIIGAEREVEDGVFESETGIEGSVEFDAEEALEATVQLTAGEQAEPDPELVRLEFHESIGMVSPEVAGHVRCDWFGIGCPDGDDAPAPSGGEPGTLDGQPVTLAQAGTGDPRSSGTHKADGAADMGLGFWIYRTYSNA